MHEPIAFPHRFIGRGDILPVAEFPEVIRVLVGERVFHGLQQFLRALARQRERRRENRRPDQEQHRPKRQSSRVHGWERCPRREFSVNGDCSTACPNHWRSVVVEAQALLRPAPVRTSHRRRLKDCGLRALAVAVVTPGPECSIRFQRDRVLISGGHGNPVGASAYFGEQVRVHACPETQLSKGIVARHPQRAVGPEGGRELIPGGDLAPVGARADSRGKPSKHRHVRAQLAAGTSAPGPECAVVSSRRACARRHDAIWHWPRSASSNPQLPAAEIQNQASRRETGPNASVLHPAHRVKKNIRRKNSSMNPRN